MRAELLWPGRYLKEADLGNKCVTVTIVKVQVDTLTMVGGRKEKKPVVYLKGTEKMWVLNKTNGMKLIELFGNETDNWVGKRVVLMPARDRFSGKIVSCIRVKSSPDAIKQQVADELPTESFLESDPIGEPAEDEPVREPGQEG